MSTLLSDLYIGPVLAPIYNWQPSWASRSTPNGFRAVSHSGHMTLTVAYQLSELVANRDRRVTIGGESGVLEYIWSESPVAANFNGWHLLTDFAMSPQKIGADARYTPITLGALHLGTYAP